MPYSYDPEIAAVVKPMFEAASQQPKLPAGDVRGRRIAVEAVMGHLPNSIPFPADVTTKDYYTTASDGHFVLVRWVTKQDNQADAGPAVFFVHGGEMFLGSVETFTTTVASLVSISGVPMAAVEYRLAPEHPHPTPVEDCYAGLTWLCGHAKELNVDPTRIGIMGESAGGGIAAGVTLMARDRKLNPPLAKSILIYPMLDDRNTVPDEKLAPFALWSYDDNSTGRGALLGRYLGGEKVSPYAAPARATDLSGLPPTYIEVGQLDIFLYEDTEYARRISQAGGEVEFHMRPGCMHAYEGLALQFTVAKCLIQDRIRVIESI